MSWKFYKNFDPAYGEDQLFIRNKDSIVTNLVMTTIPQGARYEPALRGEDVKTFLQAAMDAAYASGLRPSSAQDERHLKAHLEDMRTITFNQLGIKK